MKTGQKVILKRNPLDEQLGESITLGIKTITDTKDVSHLKGTSGLWVKIEGHDDWIDSACFAEMTDEQAAKDYAENKHGNLSIVCNVDTMIEESKDDYLAGCQHARAETNSDVMQALADVRAEEMQKGLCFAEWISQIGFNYKDIDSIWWRVIKYEADGLKMVSSTTSELFTSPEFLAYYEEMRAK